MIEQPEAYLSRVGISFTKSAGKNGRELVIDCPSCGREKKCSINSRTWKWQCFVCESAGSEVSFKRLRGDLVQVTDAAEQDAERARDEAFANAMLAKRSRTEVERWRDTLLESPDAQAARDYLTQERRISLETARALCIGWCASLPSAERDTARMKRPVRRRAASAQSSVAQSSASTGWITIPSFASHNSIGPDPSSCAMVKLRSVPPAPKAYRRVTGGDSILYCPGSLDLTDTVLVVGGELDAVVLWQLGVTNVVAGTTGEGGWSDVWTKQLEDAEDIVVVYDSDGTGQKGAEDLVKALGAHRTRLGRWPAPYNDANDALVGMGEDFDVFTVQALIASSRSPLEEGIVRIGGALRERYKARLASTDHRGISTGYPDLDDALGGVRGGEVTVLTGDTSSGKTTFVSDWIRLMASPVKSTDSVRGARAAVPTLVCAFEMGPERQLDKLVRQVSTHPPDELSEAQLDAALDTLEAMPLWMLRHYGKFSAEALRQTIQYAARRLGVRFVVLDHLHFMVDEGTDDERKQIGAICTACAEVAMQEDVHIVLVAHPHSTGSSKDKHRDNRVIQLGDLKGSSSIKQIADNVLSIWKPRTATRDGAVDDDGYGEAVLYCLKVRSDYGIEGSVPFSFWTRASRFLDPDSCGVRARLPYSAGPAAIHWTETDHD